MPAWLLVICAGLSTWRATHLVTTDSFPPVAWARDMIEERGPGWLGKLVTCDWCASVWLAAGVVGLTDLWTSVPAPLLVFGAAAALAPILSVLVERWERVEEAPHQPQPESESEMATMVSLERQVGANGTAGY